MFPAQLVHVSDAVDKPRSSRSSGSIECHDLSVTPQGQVSTSSQHVSWYDRHHYGIRPSARPCMPFGAIPVDRILNSDCSSLARATSLCILGQQPAGRVYRDPVYFGTTSCHQLFARLLVVLARLLAKAQRHSRLFTWTCLVVHTSPMHRQKLP